MIRRCLSLCIALVFSVQLFAQMNGVDQAMRDVSMVMRHDVFSAPAASRIYAYVSIAGYEAGRYDSTQATFSRSLFEMPAMPSSSVPVNHEQSAIYAIYLTAKTFVYSEDLLMEYCFMHQPLADTASAEWQFAQQIANSIFNWSKTDNYVLTRMLPRYTIKTEDGHWEPTPPDYADAIEPYWGSLRYFIPENMMRITEEPVRFSTDSSSLYYKEALAVMDAGNNLTEDQRIAVAFWDDNPFTIVKSGHLTYAQKKVTPAGHWIDITRTLCDSTGADAITRLRAYALVSIAMADAFKKVWEIKYQYNTMRPETYINKYINDGWMPMLQSPPFPEFVSGHSAVSAAAASILTSLFGQNQDFTDASETLYDLPPRSFTTVRSAALEAGMSRYMGGIHYRLSVIAGTRVGDEIARTLHSLIPD